MSRSVMPPTPSYFEILPTEILRSIITHSPSSSPLSLMRANSTLHQRIESLLYEHIEWDVERTYGKPTVHQFLSKLLVRPEVGLWVRSFTMVGRFSQKTYDGLSQTSIERLFRLAATNQPNFFLEVELEEWWQRVYTSSPVVLVSLLILLCPKISSLTPWSGYSEMPDNLNFLSRAISTLPALKTIEYATGFTKFPSISWSSNLLTFLHHIPTLRHLTIQVMDDQNSNSHSDDVPISPHIPSLTLHNSVLSSSATKTLLSKFPSIRKLHLGILRETRHNTYDPAVAGSFIDCTALAESLTHLSQTLHHLTITCEFYISRETQRYIGGPYHRGRDGNPGVFRYWGTKGHFGSSLRSFQKLQHLEIDPVVLLGWDIAGMGGLRGVLPRDLRTLKFRIDFIACKDWNGQVPWVRDVMREFFEAGGREALEVLVLQVLESHAARWVRELGELKGLCGENGVLFGVEKLIG